MSVLNPASIAELQQIVREAAAAQTPLEIIGNGTKRGIGRPMKTAQTISMAGYSGVVFHAPDEMVVRVKAGTPLKVLQKALAKKGQYLVFEPLQIFDGEQTIGGIIGSNLSGSRRISHGAARDSVIGVEFVNGAGELIKSGGRVMKNVTGYDFSKLLTGSYGTLGILTEITLKVLPIPQDEITLVYTGLEDDRAVELLCAAMCSPFEVTGAGHIGNKTYLRLEGLSEFIMPRAEHLQARLKAYGAPQVVTGAESAQIWQNMNKVQQCAGAPILWQISLAPTKAPPVIVALKTNMKSQFTHMYDWSGGRVWLGMEQVTELEAQYMREIVSAAGGHAMLFKAPKELRLAIAPFHPQNAVVAAIANQIKTAFDPQHIFNPHRMGV